MGEDDERQLLLINEKMAVMDMCNGHLVLSPLRFAEGGEKTYNIRI